MTQMVFTIAILLGMVCSSLLNCSPAIAADEPVLDGDKPLMVMLFDKHCKKWCGMIRPVLQEVRDQFGDKIAYYELDVTEDKLKETVVFAKKLRVDGFVTRSLDFVPMVGVFTPKRKVVLDAPGVKEKKAYVEAIDRALKAK